MNKRIVSAFFIIAIIFASSCSLGGSGDSDSASSVSAVLQNIPEVKQTLPKSLRAPDAKSINHISRNIGVISEVTADSLKPIKSQAWIDLQEGDSSQLMLNRAIKYIGSYAADHDIEVDKEFSVPVDSTILATVFKVPSFELSGLTVSNKCIIKGSDPKDLTLYSNIKLSTSHSSSTIKAKASIKTNADSSVSLKINIDADLGAQGSMLMYTEYNSLTGEGLSVVSMDDSFGSPTGTMIQKSIVGTGNEITTINRYIGPSGGSMNNAYIAYGNDNYGGIASVFSFTDPETSVTNTYIYREYYNSQGNLVRRDYGGTTPWTPDTTILNHQVNLKSLDGSLATPPFCIYQRTAIYGRRKHV